MPKFLSLIAALAVAGFVQIAGASAQTETLHAYGPGGPKPAMEEAAAAFEKETGVKVAVTAGPTDKWLAEAKDKADIIFSGSENMMSDFIDKMEGRIVEESVTPLYLRPSTILVRPGNPAGIGGIADLLEPGRKILVVAGAGQIGMWEDVIGRYGDIDKLKAFRDNIAVFAKNSAEAVDAWKEDASLEAWLIWNHWQIANADLAEPVPVEPELRIYRDSGIALTEAGAGKPAAAEFVAFLLGPKGEEIFGRWGWSRKPQ